MYLAKQGGLLSSTGQTPSLAQYSDNRQTAALPPSPASDWGSSAQGASGLALSPEAGTDLPESFIEVLAWVLTRWRSLVSQH